MQALECVVAQMKQEAEIVVIHLDGRVHEDDAAILHAIATQLVQIPSAKRASFLDNMETVLVKVGEGAVGCPVPSLHEHCI